VVFSETLGDVTFSVQAETRCHARNPRPDPVFRGMKVLHFSDLHLDRSFAWAPRAAGRRRRHALRTTLTNILTLAGELRVDAVACGGDLFEHERLSPDTRAFLRAAFEEIAPTRVFLAPGNHDWYGPDSPYRLVDWSPNVHVFTETRLEPVEVTPGLTLWGAGHRAPANTPNLLEGFRADRGGVNLALFHGSEQGFFPFLQEAKQPHAAFRAEQIEQAGIDHALLGHFHTPKDAARYTYPGNPDPLEFGELGERGAVLIEVTGDGAVSRERHDVSVTTVHDLAVELDGCDSVGDVRDQISTVLPAPGGWIRLRLSGDVGSDCAFHPADLEDLLEDFDAHQVQVQEVRVGYDLDAIALEQGTVRAAFVQSVRDAPTLTDEQRRRVLVTGLRALDERDDLEVF
jgi:exonuclease SbcD